MSCHDTAFRTTVGAMQHGLAGLYGSFRSDHDAVRMAPYLGDFSNATLGRIQVSVLEGQLWITFGQFHSRLRQQASETELVCLIHDPPMAAIAIPFKFTQDAQGEPVVIFATPEGAYAFSQIGSVV